MNNYDNDDNYDYKLLADTCAVAMATSINLNKSLESVLFISKKLRSLDFLYNLHITSLFPRKPFRILHLTGFFRLQRKI